MTDLAVAPELASRARLADPMPTRCSACFCSAGPDVRFVDFQAAFDGGAVVEEGSMAVRDSIDWLYLCEACVRSAAEVIAYKAELHARQLREIRRQEIEIEHWRDTARRFKGELDRQLDAHLEPPRQTVRRPRDKT